MTERLIETLRDEGSLALTTDEAKSKAEALNARNFLVLDLETLPQPEWVDPAYGSKRFAIGSVDIKRNWSDEEEVATYAKRQMALAMDHIAAAKYVLENPPPKPPQYREERRLLLKWRQSNGQFPTQHDFSEARYELLEGRGRHYDTFSEVRLLDVRKSGDGWLHLYGVEVSGKVLVEEEA